jgi:chromosome segregation ATPase
MQEAIRTRDGLAADLEKSKNEITKLKETHSAELQDFTGRYIKTRSDLEKQLRESEETRSKLEHELEKAQKTSSQADGALSEEVTRLKKELDEIQEEKKRLVLRLAETSELVSADVVNDLRQQFEGRIQEILQENTQLAEKVKNAGSQMDVVYVKADDGSGNNGSALSTLDSSAIDEEVKRVEELSAEIARLIDDPETELATVIRKNVERAALDAYLKGILFSLGRGKRL